MSTDVRQKLKVANFPDSVTQMCCCFNAVRAKTSQGLIMRIKKGLINLNPLDYQDFTHLPL